MKRFLAQWRIAAGWAVGLPVASLVVDGPSKLPTMWLGLVCMIAGCAIPHMVYVTCKGYRPNAGDAFETALLGPIALLYGAMVLSVAFIILGGIAALIAHALGAI